MVRLAVTSVGDTLTPESITAFRRTFATPFTLLVHIESAIVSVADLRMR